jgi:hypothetical protein
MKTDKTTLRIGSSSDADIVLNEPTVSRYHCELRWQQGDWVLRDLDSTNGTYVDGKRITEPVRVTQNNKITLGRDIALDLPGAPVPAEPSVAIQRPPTMPVHERQTAFAQWPMVIASVSLLAVVALLGWHFGSSPQVGNSPLVNNDIDAAVQKGSGSASENASKPLIPAVTGQSATTNSKASDVTTEASMVESKRLEDPAIWAVIAMSADGRSQKLMGTAIAVSPNRLITLASIVEAIEVSRASFPKLTLTQSIDPKKRIVPTQILIHPKNKDAMVKLSDFEAQLAEKIKSVDSTIAEPSLDESLEWSSKLEAIMSEIARTDLACLVVAEKLSAFSKIRELDDSNPPFASTLQGFPTIVPSPDINGDFSNLYVVRSANCRVDKKLKQPALVAEAVDSSSISMISAACMTSSSEVVGLCVREVSEETFGVPRHCQITPLEVFW